MHGFIYVDNASMQRYVYVGDNHEYSLNTARMLNVLLLEIRRMAALTVNTQYTIPDSTSRVIIRSTRAFMLVRCKDLRRLLTAMIRVRVCRICACQRT